MQHATCSGTLDVRALHPHRQMVAGLDTHPARLPDTLGDRTGHSDTSPRQESITQFHDLGRLWSNNRILTQMPVQGSAPANAPRTKENRGLAAVLSIALRAPRQACRQEGHLPIGLPKCIVSGVSH